MAVLVGTASWSSKTLVDSARFYPPGVTSAEARLRYCASRFPLVEVEVEVDSSYYAMPTPATAPELAGQVGQLATQALATHVVFNNNMEDQGQRNAATLTQLLQR
jgi:uncharacterized protein YecE (DUF72 family)